MRWLADDAERGRLLPLVGDVGDVARGDGSGYQAGDHPCTEKDAIADNRRVVVVLAGKLEDVRDKGGSQGGDQRGKVEAGVGWKARAGSKEAGDAGEHRQREADDARSEAGGLQRGDACLDKGRGAAGEVGQRNAKDCAR
ncbi:uncharacterized protein AMSG_07402 [Thecamonas trahens ATCC 50062]|uniref:Uncharacterized protein n=1 Tax=Thecamonas trahens ATCC 50062 TaxID=461836 RepID=A0A0L0DGP3_THETB|nr:hypothetical protein AMSG_07402 [Thecamonas trahens ATCC 50062]KNC51509.1 hypothetical protein AMSG_07402 [Thecamonas trahens ATCC 50062]|eukprot:XP_013755912.1 hypothetical protein AMSG_07402 [Thecamonas trahens ATCC 50062]